MSSKLLGSESDFFAEMVVSAMEGVKTVNKQGETKYPVKAVNLLKCHGLSTKQSTMINGYAIEATRSS